METDLVAPSKSTFIALRDAVLCLDCNFLSDAQDQCCVCGGRSLRGFAPPSRSSFSNWEVTILQLVTATKANDPVLEEAI